MGDDVASATPLKYVVFFHDYEWIIARLNSRKEFYESYANAPSQGQAMVVANALNKDAS